MSKIDVENITINKWIILIGQYGISLLEKGKTAKFDVIAARRWGIISTDMLIENLVDSIPDKEKFDLVLDDQMTTVSYSAPAVAQSGTNVTEAATTVTVQFFDILKSRDCTLISEKSDLNEMVEAFSPFFDRIRRVVLRGPTTDFRYVVYVETSAIVQRPNAWIGSITSDLSSILLNRPTAGINSPVTDMLKSIAGADHATKVYPIGAHQKDPRRPVSVDAVQDALPSASFLSPNLDRYSPTAVQDPTATPKIVQLDQPSPKDVATSPVSPDADQPVQSADQTRKLTLIFSTSDAPAIALLAAGVVWSLSTASGQAKPMTITEIGAYRKKLSSPFRRLVGVSAHQETDKLPLCADQLDRLIQDINTATGTSGDHVLFFGYEILSPELLINISRFLQETSAKYQIIVCHDSVAQSDEVMDFESVFDGLPRKSWIYLEDTDKAARTLHLPFWKKYKTPSLDDAILKKLMLGEFRVFEKLASDKTSLSILQSSEFHNWVADFSACTAPR